MKYKFSSGYLIALASRMATEVGEAQAAADKAGRPMATLSATTEVRLRSPSKTGWEYFLYNLRLYLETHQGRTRRMISERLPVKAPRDTAWKHIASAVTGVAPAAVTGLAAGDRIRLPFDGGPTANGVVELVVVGKGLAIRLPELTDSVLFIELEGGPPESFHTGWWLSVYDADRAKELEAPAKRTFLRIHESMPMT